jgi:hypothetical protein
MLQQLFAVVAPVLICAGLGFLWVRLGRRFDTRLVTELLTLVGTPCLVASTLTRLELDLALVGEMAMAALLALTGFALIGLATLRAMKLPAHSFLPALMFPNTGNMGLPLCLFAFGEEGLALAILFFTLTAVGQFTVGIAIAAGSWSPARVLRMPLPYAVIAAVLVLATDTPVPKWIANTLDLVGGVVIPLMLIALGVSLAELKIASIGRSLALALVRLGGGAAVGFALAYALGLEGAARGVLVIQSAMPVAVFNYLFAQLYDRAPAEVAGAIVVSTLLSFASLPLLLLLVL